jgi:hypothetical protein
MLAGGKVEMPDASAGCRPEFSLKYVEHILPPFFKKMTIIFLESNHVRFDQKFRKKY